MGKSESMHVRAYVVRTFWRGLYRDDGTVTAVLTMHSTFFGNDDCPYDD